MRKPTLLIILALAGFSILQVVIHLSSGPEVDDWHPDITAVTDEDFDRTIDESVPWVVLKAWAPWCDVCKRMRPVYNAAAAGFAKDDIRLLRLNTEEQTEWADTYRVDGLPAMIIFYQGQEISRHAGYLPEEALLNWIQHTTGLTPDTP